MDSRRPLLSPLAVLVSGLVATLAWLAIAAAALDLPGSGFAALVSGGCAGTLGATAISIGQRLVNQRIARHLDQVRHDARHDALTGLVNRAELFRQLRTALGEAAAESTLIGVLFLDLDRFKEINDTLGHEAGDELLRIVADRLRAATRGTDVVARLGGDEFVVVCRGLLSSGSVIGVAKQVRRRIDEPVALGGTMQEIGSSIGVAIAEPGDQRSAEEIIRDADSAMYKAKREHLGHALFDEAHRLQLMDRAATERDLGQALEEEQFVVYYQPVVDVVEGRLLGLEAFVRWKHPERGLIEPDQFLPIAQGAGLMSEIGVRVLRETCAQLAVWKHTWPAAAELWVSVNLAEEQLLDGNLAHQVNDILSWTALSPSQLVIEVSEDTMSANIGQLDVLRQIKALGVRVTIDGYGAGRSSFSYVKELDMVSSLKIDRSFVIDLIGYRATSSAVRAMVATARELELELMVDGVEDPDQSDLLVALGLRVMQGYLFSEPVPPEVADHRGWFDEAVSPRWQVSQGHTLATLGAGKATSRASS